MSLSSQPAKAPPMHRQTSVFRTQESASSSSNVTTMSNPSTTPNATNSMPSTFEFTKRKRWADLLIHELSEAIIFVLSNECRVLFCSRAVSELLGWRDAELIDKNLVDLVNGEYACCVPSSCYPRVLICQPLLEFLRRRSACLPWII
jgi:PAS domain-containing protein